MPDRKTFPGVWRGIVVDNDDQHSGRHQYLARLKVKVPEVYGKDIEDDDLPWAWPCLGAGGGKREGVSHGEVNIPPIDSSVWIAFERGDPNFPVWLGTWYGEKDSPPELPREAIRDQDIQYPDIYVLKFPWKDNCYIRCSEDKKFEIVFDNTNKIQFDDRDGKKRIYVQTTEWDIEASSEEGDIKATAQEGKITVHAVNGDMDFKAGGDIRIKAEGELRLIGTNEAKLMSPNAIHGAAPVASGFDRHP